MLLDHLSTPLPVSCLRAGLSISCDGYGMRATPCCVIVLLDLVSWLLCCVVVLVWFVFIVCKPCLRAGWGTLCSLVAIASLPRHGRNTEHGPFPRIWLTPSNYDGKLLSRSLGCGHLGLDVVIDADSYPHVLSPP
jgi:hypothetical protein